MVKVRILFYFELQKVSFSISNIRPSFAKPIETDTRETNLTVLDPTYRHQAYPLLVKIICRMARFATSPLDYLPGRGHFLFSCMLMPPKKGFGLR